MLTGMGVLPSELYVQNEKERSVRLSVNPFREPPAGPTGHDLKQEEVERPPEWLELVCRRSYAVSIQAMLSNRLDERRPRRAIWLGQRPFHPLPRTPQSQNLAPCGITQSFFA